MGRPMEAEGQSRDDCGCITWWAEIGVGLVENPLFLESMIPTTASVFVADTSVSERRKGVRHQLCWLWWPVTAKLMIAACLYSFCTFHLRCTGNTE